MSQDKDLAYLNSWLSQMDKKKPTTKDSVPVSLFSTMAKGNKEETLGEYLEKFSNKQAQNSVVKNNLINEIEELLAELDDSSIEDSGQMVERSDILSGGKNFTVVETKKFIGKTYNSDNVFSKLGRERKQVFDQRKAKFANTNAKLIDERTIAPLNLPQYESE